MGRRQAGRFGRFRTVSIVTRVHPGAELEQVISDICAISDLIGKAVETEFSGVRILVLPNSNPQSVLDLVCKNLKIERRIIDG